MRPDALSEATYPDTIPEGTPSTGSTDPGLEDLAQEVIERAQEEVKAPPARQIAPTMGKIAKISYTHDGMIDLIIAQPQLSQGQLALKFGYTPAWISNIMASDAFQARLAERRKEVIDPTLVATIEERVRGMMLQGIEVVQRKLEEPSVKPEVALRAVELGAKALGLGGNAPPKATVIDLSALADRLTALRGGPRAIEGESHRVE